MGRNDCHEYIADDTVVISRMFELIMRHLYAQKKITAEKYHDIIGRLQFVMTRYVVSGDSKEIDGWSNKLIGLLAK